MSRMPWPVRMMDRVDQVLVWLSQALLAAMVGITFVSVVGRSFFRSPVPDDLLLSEMLMVAIVFVPLSYVQSIRAHIEVTVLTDHLPHWLQETLVSLGLIIGIVMFAWMAWLSAGKAWESYEWGEIAYASTLELPEWPVRALIPLGLIWWCVRMLIQLLMPWNREPPESEVERTLRESEDA
ncbi:TRAP transporter small permease [Alloalcanivorax dieselolei]|nr:TRAP transporter small permease [Alloalcanivorax dieselolei]